MVPPCECEGKLKLTTPFDDQSSDSTPSGTKRLSEATVPHPARLMAVPPTTSKSNILAGDSRNASQPDPQSAANPLGRGGRPCTMHVCL